MPRIASREEIKELRALVRAGRLLDVVAWLDAGKPFRSGNPRLAPYEPYLVAVETGFFSMVEAFLRQELQEEELGRMLRIAVGLHRPDLVEVLLSRGASVDAVDFDDVLLNWHPEVTKIFLRYGADYKEDSPFAEAFIRCCRTAIGIFKTLLQKEPELISQANEALIKHVRTNNRKWVDLMLWLGADPRAEVVIDDEVTTALHETAKYGRAELLRRFKVDPKRDDLNALVAAPVAYLHFENVRQAKPQAVESLEYLLSFGPDLRPPIGSSIMEHFFRQIEHDNSHRLWDYVFCLAKHGVQYESENLWSVRGALRKLDDYVRWTILLELAKTRALSPKALKALIRTPAMRELINANPADRKIIKEAAGIRSLNAMIVQSVEQGIRRLEEIAAKIGITEDEVKRRSARLIKSGYLVKWGRKRYRICPGSWRLRKLDS